MTKQKRPADFAPMPFDSVVRLDVNAFLVLGADCFPSPSMEEHATRFRQIRGEFLAGMFAIQNELVLLTLLKEFRTFAVSVPGDEISLREEDLRSQTLGILINSAKVAITTEMPRKEVASLMRDLAEAKAIRDAMAHQPFWLEPLNDENAGTFPGAPLLRTVQFAARIANADFIWTVDDAQVDEWATLVTDVTRRLMALRIAIAKERALDTSSPEGSSPKGKASPIGIFLPAGRPIPNPESRLMVLFNGEPEPALPLVPGPLAKVKMKEQRKTLAYLPQEIGSRGDGDFPMGEAFD